MMPLERAQHDVRKLRRLCMRHDETAGRYRAARLFRDETHVRAVCDDRAALAVAEHVLRKAQERAR